MSADDQPIAVTLTVQQWREIKAELELGVSWPLDDLRMQLDEYDLSGGCTDEGCSCGGPSCVETASCEDGDHTLTWPCDLAPGTGRCAAMSADAEQARRAHDALAVAVTSTQRHAAQIVTQLIELQRFHPHHDLDYTDALKAYYRAAKELRDLARIAQLWGGQS